ncbi:NAD(P)H-binding protein [Myxococcaceae bacterium JPH2]|nr:NAD(P)H-binding protein [Myxococcaceae bacterium JPH2]
MIVVTGANGNVGSALVRNLRRAGHATRAVTRDAKRTVVPEGTEVVTGDLTKAESLRPALQGAQALFLLMTAGDVANRVDLPAVLALAREAGVKRAVVVSSLLAGTHPHTVPGGGALMGEQLVRESGLEWTILRPWEFASNVMAWVPSIQAEGVVRVVTSGLASAAVHPGDIADVAFHALTEPGHAGAIYPLTGPQALTPQQKVHALSVALGRELTFVDQNDTQALAEMAKHAPDADSVKLMIPGVCGLESPAYVPTMERIAGTPARTFQQWAQEHVSAFRLARAA